MAIQNNTYFRALIDPLDSSGAAEISNADRVNIIGGGAVDEQQIILENSNHAYSTINRRVVSQLWSLGAGTSDTLNNYLAKETGTSLVTVVETVATVGADRQEVVACLQYQGTAEVEILTPALVSLDSQGFTNVAAPDVGSVTLSWSTTTQVIVRIKIAAVTSPSAADGFLWGFRILENQTSL